jgi:hypothetical protein
MENNLEISEAGNVMAGVTPASQVLEMAERQGFEPWNTREDVTGIPVQRLRPLGHLSAAETDWGAKVTRGPQLRQRASGKRDSGSPQGIHDLTVKRVREGSQGKPDPIGHESHSCQGPFRRDRV